MGFFDCEERVAALRARFSGRARDANAVRLILLDETQHRTSVFPASTPLIKIGRDRSWADFVLPIVNVAASREHLVLIRQDSGGWLAVRQGDKYFEVNGRPIEINAALSSGDILTLGRRTGPRILFEIDFGPPQNGWSGGVTRTQEVVVGWQEGLCRHSRKVVAGFAATASAIAALAGYTVWSDWQLGKELRQTLDARIEATLERPSEFSPEVVERLQRAAYVVIACEPNPAGPCTSTDGQRAIATAWPVRANRLVTNAHVVEAFKRIYPQASLCVRPSETGGGSKAHCTDRWTLHDGRDAFKAAVSDVGSRQAYEDEFTVATRPGAYDVAILEFDEPLAGDRVLEIADPSSLRVGEKVAFAGYLLRRTDGHAQQAFDPVPRVHFGNVSAMTDFFMFSSATEDAQLVHNTIPMTGGASGSPVINTAGLVVAVVSSGSVIPIADGDDGDKSLVPSASLVNYAQRVDLVSHMLGGLPFEASKATTRWREAALKFSDPRPHIQRSALERATRVLGGAFSGKPMATVTRSLPKSYSHEVVARTLQAGKSYTAVVYSDTSEPVQLNIRGVRKCEDNSRWPTLFIQARRDVDVEFVIFGSGELDRSFDLVLYETTAAATDSLTSVDAVECIRE